MAALPHGEVAGALAKVRASAAGTSTNGAAHPPAAADRPAAGVPAGLRVPGPHGGSFRGSTAGDVKRDRSCRRGVDRASRANEGEPLAPGAAVRPRRGNPKGGANPGRRRSAGVPEPSREGPLGHDFFEAGQGAGDRGRAARLPVELPGLGRGGDERSARGRRGGALAHVVQNKVVPPPGPRSVPSQMTGVEMHRAARTIMLRVASRDRLACRRDAINRGRADRERAAPTPAARAPPHRR